MILNDQAAYGMMCERADHGTFAMNIGSMNATKSSYIMITEDEHGNDHGNVIV